MYSANMVSCYILKYCETKNYSVANLKLQKLLYFVQAYFLIESEGKHACFYDRIEAWDFGPVVPSVYHLYKCFGCGTLWSSFAEKWDKYGIPLSEPDKKSINHVMDEMAIYSSTELVKISQNQMPWRESYVPYQGREIKNESIYNYFSSP